MEMSKLEKIARLNVRIDRAKREGIYCADLQERLDKLKGVHYVDRPIVDKAAHDLSEFDPDFAYENEYFGHVITVINAIREPSEKMLGGKVGDGLQISREDKKAIWQAMIDEALDISDELWPVRTNLGTGGL